MPDMKTVGELREYLQTLPAERKVLLAQDPEGNGFGFLVEADESTVAEDYRPDSVYPTPEQYAEMDEDEYDPPADTRVLVLWPA